MKYNIVIDNPGFQKQIKQIYISAHKTVMKHVVYL